MQAIRFAPPGMFPQIKVLETNAPRAGIQYTAAGGHKIPNLGMQRPFIHFQDGTRHVMTFQVAGNRVVFDDPNRVGSFTENKASGKRTPLRQHNGVYYMDVWM